jgi:hypothetical protein
MDTTKDDYTGTPDLPQHTPRKSPERDRQRSAWLILGGVAAAVALVGILA